MSVILERTRANIQVEEEKRSLPDVHNHVAITRDKIVKVTYPYRYIVSIQQNGQLLYLADHHLTPEISKAFVFRSIEQWVVYLRATVRDWKPGDSRVHVHEISDTSDVIA
jgi:hypothetical protein